VVPIKPRPEDDGDVLFDGLFIIGIIIVLFLVLAL